MGIKVNMSNVTSFEALPNGDYPGKIKALTPKKFSSGNDGLELVVALTPDPERSVGNGRQVFNNFVFTDKALWRFQQFLVRMGMPKEQAKGELEIEPTDYVGKDVVVTLGPPDPGYNNNRVLDVWGPEGRPAREGAPSEAASEVTWQ